jgi:mRNA-degrading endonuclease RelE of RelBE toxin-antitoxin system
MLILDVTPQARRDLRNMPPQDRLRMEDRLEAYAADPRQANVDIDTVKGRPELYRLRSGDWRAVFTVTGNTMTVKRVRHRREIYR